MLPFSFSDGRHGCALKSRYLCLQNVLSSLFEKTLDFRKWSRMRLLDTEKKGRTVMSSRRFLHMHKPLKDSQMILKRRRDPEKWPRRWIPGYPRRKALSWILFDLEKTNKDELYCLYIWCWEFRWVLFRKRSGQCSKPNKFILKGKI